MSLLLLLNGAPAAPPAPVASDLPDPVFSIAWATNPLDAPVYTDMSDYIRDADTSRGRSYEYDRMETGVLSYTLSNRDSHFDPDNASSPYYPNVKPTRRVLLNAEYDSVVYPIMEAFSEGYPNAFPGEGNDAVVHQSASDWFYPLNVIKFSPASTTLTGPIATTPEAGTEEVISVASTALPLPQAFPFVIQIGTGDYLERLEVTGSPAVGQWTVLRGHQETAVGAHDTDSVVTAEEVRFAQELSGTRLNNCLDMLGVVTVDRDIDDGNSMIAVSDNLAGQSVLEHMLLIAECENGRLFADRTGRISFRERHWQYTDELSPRATFGPGVGEIRFLSGSSDTLDYPDAKIANRVRIKLPTEQIVESSDQDSIDSHFERVLQKEWPLAFPVEAQDAADYMLGRLKQVRLRVPTIALRPRGDDWATVLDVELAQRYRLKYDPPVGSTAVDTEVIVERIRYDIRPADWTVSYEFSLAEQNVYWRLDNAGQTELDSTTRLAY